MRKVNVVNVIDGDGAKVKRLMPVAGLRNFDPFVLMDHFVLEKGMGFPTHPHRGFEGITYLLSGSMNHKDNLGNNQTIYAGGAQRFTAGSGMEHSEMPSESETTEGIQLWVNLPKSKKSLPASYQQVEKEDFEIQAEKGLIHRPLAGENGKIKLQENISYDDYELEKKAKLQIDNKQGDNQFIYLLSGQLKIGDDVFNAGECYLIEHENSISFTAVQNARLIVLSGKPIGEPIYQNGPYVD